MSWHVKLGGQLSVWKDGSELPGPENKTVGVLLVGLLFRGSDWSSRHDLANLLYPDSEEHSKRTALRQSLLRLRRWCGPDCIEEKQGLTRLSGGAWSYDLTLSNGEGALASMIAPNLDHPWIEAIRQSLTPQKQEQAIEAVEDFATAVGHAASIDKDTGRSLLVGGAALIQSLPIEQLRNLLSMTQPKDRRDPFTLEHQQLRAHYYERLGCYREIKETGLRAFRLATQQRKQEAMITSGAYMLFYEIEDGQMGEAAAWIDHLQSRLHADTKSLFFINAKAAYHWNMNRHEEAIAQMNQGIKRLPSTDRATRLHFWVNYSVLCAEARQLDQADEALEEARKLVIDQFDRWRILTMKYAEAILHMHRRNCDESIRMFESLAAANQEHYSLPGIWYANEGLSDALMSRGDLAEARSIWLANEKSRLSFCTRLTPRLQARRSRVLR